MESLKHKQYWKPARGRSQNQRLCSLGSGSAGIHLTRTRNAWPEFADPSKCPARERWIMSRALTLSLRGLDPNLGHQVRAALSEQEKRLRTRPEGRRKWTLREHTNASMSASGYARKGASGRFSIPTLRDCCSGLPRVGGPVSFGVCFSAGICLGPLLPDGLSFLARVVPGCSYLPTVRGCFGFPCADGCC